MDRITRVRIENVRAIESLDLELGNPLTVLIGGNGSGKSTIIECLELLRKAADPNFMQAFYTQHRGMPGLLRGGASELTLGVRVEDRDRQTEPLDYTFSLHMEANVARISSEKLSIGAISATGVETVALHRNHTYAKIWNDRDQRIEDMSTGYWSPDELILGSFGKRPPSVAAGRLITALRGIEVHLGFDILASWAAQSIQRAASLRGTTMLLPANRLTLLGQNLASAWSALKNVNETHWRDTMDLVRLGLGENVDSINTIPDAGGGHVSLSLKRSDLSEPIPAANLSDGQLSWLAFVAMARLNPNRSLLAIDEPELHMHPSLLGRVVSLFANLKGKGSVVLSTHSDRVLEMLDDPADAVRVCSLEGSKAVISRIDAEALPQWLEEFGDVGQLRASGYLSRVLVPTTTEFTQSTESHE